jgi:membrane protease YdiL (CAAX protease family)
MGTMINKIALGIFLVPLIETLLIQYLIISFICRIIRRPKYNFYTSILVSALFFSINHPYSSFYLTYTFFGGLTLAFAYYITRYRRQNAFLTVFIIHAVYNSYALFVLSST